MKGTDFFIASYRWGVTAKTLNGGTDFNSDEERPGIVAVVKGEHRFYNEVSGQAEAWLGARREKVGL